MTPSEVAGRLAANALSVCRHYLSNGHRVGNYWVVGDARNAPGRSTFVRLFKDLSGRPAGRWTDAATGEYGDLLDIIRFAVQSGGFIDAVAEAEAFTGGPVVQRRAHFRTDRPLSVNHARMASRLYSDGVPIAGTLGGAYLIGRHIDPMCAPGLRFMPRCYCRPTPDSDRTAWPTIIAPVTNDAGTLKGVQRLYLDQLMSDDLRLGKAPLDRPKRSLGHVHGNTVKFGEPAATVAIAEGIENALSVRTAIPDLTCYAALSAGNLAIFAPPPSVRRLLIALDDDDAGRWAARTLAERCRLAGLPVTLLTPRCEDHNLDLRTLGLAAYRALLRQRLAT